MRGNSDEKSAQRQCVKCYLSLEKEDTDQEKVSTFFFSPGQPGYYVSRGEKRDFPARPREEFNKIRASRCFQPKSLWDF